MGCSCNFFGRVITITSPRSHDGVDGRTSKSKKKRKKGRRGGPMDDDDVEEGSVEYRCLPHPERPPAAYNAQSMARSVIYSNDSPIVVMHAPAADYSHTPPPATSYAYAAPAAAAVVLDQLQVPTPSKSRVRFSPLPADVGGGRQHKDVEPVVAMPVGVPLAADTYYQHPQHDHNLQIVQQHSSSSHNQQLQQPVRHEGPAVTATPAVCGAYHTPPPHVMHQAMVPPEYSHGYPTPMREAVYRIGTDANRFSIFSDENPNACALM